MKSIVARSQKVHVIERMNPTIKPSYLLIKTLHSVISPGTELSLIGISEDREIALGYSAVGSVVKCGEGVDDYQIGDIVACYGAPYVGHSDCLLVPTTLCAKVPSGVEPKEAALAGIGAIAIHALRIAKLEFGETVVIVGLGLLGQMIAKIANAAAYHVVAFDIEAERAAMLHEEASIRSFSTIPEMESEIKNGTKNYGADAVLLCVGGKGSSLTNQSLGWIRHQGKVVIVGDIEPDFPRNLLFAKEAQILISRAGGPGRYDQVYEGQAIDYPYGYVRWTEGRNVAEYLRLVNDKRINVQLFLTDEVDFRDVPAAYDDLINKKTMTLTKIINY
ncbi:zinc-dependent alcohol dehydrogenase [Sporosarcina limicola]|uniref:Threonine dehydrogenase-like Zn-dependent dehydrogenase n=1 Tax=Sporosarcina limicola TaxID=34101 RepID=A0A927REE7_9BACL|nr:zinc-binding alcohol dehydrogenase [Sporosarcina limicola]MBE1554537.1 threonine dehydrogenase-like Zn-dependent dehydrogenase [Sporosarcina limicola]